MIVSHDRYFMDKLVDHLLVFEGEGQVRDFPGNYSDYRIWQEQEEARKNAAASSEKEKTANVSNAAPAASKKKVSFKEKREFELLEGEMSALNKEKQEITEKLSTGALPFDELQALSERIAAITTSLDEKEMRWLELSELIEG
jgi:ATP-binding cassette subfamily F protein uup